MQLQLYVRSVVIGRYTDKTLDRSRPSTLGVLSESASAANRPTSPPSNEPTNGSHGESSGPSGKIIT
jgi:hypothetical protein